MIKKIFLASLLSLIAIFAIQAKEKEAVVELTDSKAAVLIDKATRPYVIDFSATWCGPCRIFAPTFHEVATEMGKKVDFYKVDVDKSPQLARKYNVRAVPTIIIYNPKTKNSERIEGVTSKADLVENINGML